MLCAQATWVTATPAGTRFATALTGTDLAPVAVTCALVAVAGAVAVVATRGLGRRLVGVLLVAVALVLVGGPLQVLADPAGAARRPLAVLADGAAVAPRSASVAWWWCALAAVGGLAVLTGAALTVARSAGWPVMSARYDAQAGPRRTPRAAADDWARLDRGEDPTVDPQTDPAEGPAPGPGQDVDAGSQQPLDPGPPAASGDLQE